MKHSNEAICPLCELKLKDAHPDLAIWFYFVKECFPEVHISCSSRNEEDQERLFREKKTTLHFPFSRHNEAPAKALDIFQLKEGKAVWDRGFFVDIYLFSEYVGFKLRWGGNFEKLKDYSHFEIPKGSLRRLYEKICNSL